MPPEKFSKSLLLPLPTTTTTVAINPWTERSFSCRHLNRRAYAHVGTPYNSNGSIVALCRRDSRMELGPQLSQHISC